MKSYVLDARSLGNPKKTPNQHLTSMWYAVKYFRQLKKAYAIKNREGNYKKRKTYLIDLIVGFHASKEQSSEFLMN